MSPIHKTVKAHALVMTVDTRLCNLHQSNTGQGLSVESCFQEELKEKPAPVSSLVV